MAEERTEETRAKEEGKPPKKRVKMSTKKKEPEPVSETEDTQTETTKKKAKGSKKRSGAYDHPRTVDMIIEALENLEDTQGSSVQAIKSYIIDNYKVRDDMIKSMMKRALTKALADNLISRPKNQTQNTQVLSGRYLIRPKTAEETEPPKPRLPKLRQLSVLKSLGKSKSKSKSKKKRKKHGFY